jgi:transposase InsO family protein
VDEAMLAGARKFKCCEVIGISLRTLKRWRKPLSESDTASEENISEDRRPHAIRPTPANALTSEEREEILKVCNTPENASKPAPQIVTELADQGIYLGSESTFYRILLMAGMLFHRGRARAPKRVPKPTTYTATGPNQVWCWDITYLPTRIKGIYLKLYVILDLYSRKVVAYEVFPEENAEHSQEVLRRAALSENIAAQSHPVVLHGDNGSPLKAGTVLALIQALGMVASHSRPRVSNDNAFAEALFRTVKYHPKMPEEGFANAEDARTWAHSFFGYYNNKHNHSSLRHVTPAQKHAGDDIEILEKRKNLYETKRALKPERWIQKKTRNWSPVESTSLNPVNDRKLEKIVKNIR